MTTESLGSVCFDQTHQRPVGSGDVTESSSVGNVRFMGTTFDRVSIVFIKSDLPYIQMLPTALCFTFKDHHITCFCGEKLVFREVNIQIVSKLGTFNHCEVEYHCKGVLEAIFAFGEKTKKCYDIQTWKMEIMQRVKLSDTQLALPVCCLCLIHTSLSHLLSWHH